MSQTTSRPLILKERFQIIICYIIYSFILIELCDNDDFWCASGLGCIDQSFVCDSVLHCVDGSDEFNCCEYKCAKSPKC